MPYDTPEGYFEGMKAGLKMIPAHQRHKVSHRRWRYAGIAAAAVLFLAAGGFLAERLTGGEEFTEEDYIVFSDDLNTVYQEISGQYASTDLTEEDIIEYLIYTGVEVEEL